MAPLIEFLAGILFVVFGSLASAGLTHLYVFSIGEPGRKDGPVRGRIASRVGLWLHQRYGAFQLVTGQLQASKLRTAKTPKEVERAQRWDRVNPYKLLGMCPRCSGFWICLLMFGAMWMAYPVSPWWVVPFVPLSSIALGFSRFWN